MLTYERIYYQENPRRLPVCTFPIHSLLHIADYIEGWGPVWCYWSYPMERFCGHLKRGGAASKRLPYKSLDNYVFDWAILWHLGAIYNIRDMLSLKRGPKREKGGKDDKLEIPDCEFKDRLCCWLICLLNDWTDDGPGGVLTGKREASERTRSEVFLYILGNIIHHLQVQSNPSAVWSLQDALSAATFTEWTKFKRRNSQDVFHPASQYSRAMGRRDARYARVRRQLPSEMNKLLTSSSMMSLTPRCQMQTRNRTRTMGASSTSYRLNLPRDLRASGWRKGQLFPLRYFTDARYSQKRTHSCIVLASVFIQGRRRISLLPRSRVFAVLSVVSKMDGILGRSSTGGGGFLAKHT